MPRQLGDPSVPMKSPKRLREIPWCFMLSLGNAGEARWGCRGGLPPPPCSWAQGSSHAPTTYLAFAEHGDPCPGPLSWSHLSPARGCSGPLFLSHLSPAPTYPQPKDLSLSPGPACPCPLVPSPGPTPSLDPTYPCPLVPLVPSPGPSPTLSPTCPLVSLVPISCSHLFHLLATFFLFPGSSCPQLLVPLVPSLGHASPQLLVSFVFLSWSCWSCGTIHPLAFSYSSPSPCPTCPLSLSQLSLPQPCSLGQQRQFWRRPGRIQCRLLGPEPFPIGGSPTQPPRPPRWMP